MTTQILRDKVIKSVEKLDNVRLLESLLNLIELESENDLIFEFNEEQLALIDTAKQKVREGKTQSDEEVNKEIDEWLNS